MHIQIVLITPLASIISQHSTAHSKHTKPYKIQVAVPTNTTLAFSPPSASPVSPTLASVRGWDLVSFTGGRDGGTEVVGGRVRVGGRGRDGLMVKVTCFILDF